MIQDAFVLAMIPRFRDKDKIFLNALTRSSSGVSSNGSRDRAVDVPQVLRRQVADNLPTCKDYQFASSQFVRED